MYMKFFSQKGFTVLELLVVLFILTILLSIVLISFTRGNKNTKNKVSISEFNLVQVALEEYRAQCKVYPVELDTGANNAYPGGPDCILKFGEILPENIDLANFSYASLRSEFSGSGVCSAYHLSRELYDPSRYLEDDDDWGGDSNWTACQSGPNEADYADPWYDIVYGIPRDF